MRKIISAATLATAFSSTVAYGFAITDLKFNAFMDAAVAWSTADYLASGVMPIYVSRITNSPSFEKDTNVGIQITKDLRDDVSLTVQLYAQASSDYEIHATWAFIAYEPNDMFRFRAGRVRGDTYMLSEFVNVAYTYPWIRPPQEVYTQNPIDNYTGVDARFHINFWQRDLSILAFLGSAAVPAGNTNLLLRHLFALSAKFGNEVFSIRGAYQSADLTFYPNAGASLELLNTFVDAMVNLHLLGPDYYNYFSLTNARGNFMGVGYQFDWNNIVSMGEWAHRHIGAPALASPIGWYLMLGYKVRDIMPHITYARERIDDNAIRRFPGVVNARAVTVLGATLDNYMQRVVGTSYAMAGGAGEQTSVTLGIRWDVIDGVALKGEYCHVHPDYLSPGLFDVSPHKSVNIYSLAVNVSV